jgi:membrane protein DedA with SNARE-associated domain
VPAWLLSLFAHYGYAVVFIGVMAEGAGVPVPGETALLAAGALAHFGELSLGWVMLAAMAGALAGDNLGFLVGRLGGRALAERHGARLGLTKERLAGFDRFFERYGPKAIVIARFVTGLRVVCAVLAGGSGLKWRRFAAYNAVGVVTWSIVIGLIGYFLGESWDLLERWIGRSSVVVLAVILVLAAAWFIRARRAPSTS